MENADVVKPSSKFSKKRSKLNTNQNEGPSEQLTFDKTGHNVIKTKRSFWKNFTSIFKFKGKKSEVPELTDERSNLNAVSRLNAIFEEPRQPGSEEISVLSDIEEMKRNLRNLSTNPATKKIEKILENRPREDGLDVLTEDSSTSGEYEIEDEEEEKRIRAKNELNKDKDEKTLENRADIIFGMLKEDQIDEDIDDDRGLIMKIDEEQVKHSEDLDNVSFTKPKQIDEPVLKEMTNSTIEKDNYSFEYSTASNQSAENVTEENTIEKIIPEKVTFNDKIKTKDSESNITIRPLADTYSNSQSDIDGQTCPFPDRQKECIFNIPESRQNSPENIFGQNFCPYNIENQNFCPYNMSRQNDRVFNIDRPTIECPYNQTACPYKPNECPYNIARQKDSPLNVPERQNSPANIPQRQRSNENHPDSVSSLPWMSKEDEQFAIQIKEALARSEDPLDSFGRQFNCVRTTLLEDENFQYDHESASMSFEAKDEIEGDRGDNEVESFENEESESQEADNFTQEDPGEDEGEEYDEEDDEDIVMDNPDKSPGTSREVEQDDEEDDESEEKQEKKSEDQTSQCTKESKIGKRSSFHDFKNPISIETRDSMEGEDVEEVIKLIKEEMQFSNNALSESKKNEDQTVSPASSDHLSFDKTLEELKKDLPFTENLEDFQEMPGLNLDKSFDEIKKDLANKYQIFLDKEEKPSNVFEEIKPTQDINNTQQTLEDSIEDMNKSLEKVDDPFKEMLQSSQTLDKSYEEIKKDLDNQMNSLLYVLPTIKTTKESEKLSEDSLASSQTGEEKELNGCSSQKNNFFGSTSRTDNIAKPSFTTNYIQKNPFSLLDRDMETTDLQPIEEITEHTFRPSTASSIANSASSTSENMFRMDDKNRIAAVTQLEFFLHNISSKISDNMSEVMLEPQEKEENFEDCQGPVEEFNECQEDNVATPENSKEQIGSYTSADFSKTHSLSGSIAAAKLEDILQGLTSKRPSKLLEKPNKILEPEKNKDNQQPNENKDIGTITTTDLKTLQDICSNHPDTNLEEQTSDDTTLELKEDEAKSLEATPAEDTAQSKLEETPEQKLKDSVSTESLNEIEVWSQQLNEICGVNTSETIPELLENIPSSKGRREKRLDKYFKMVFDEEQSRYTIKYDPLLVQYMEKIQQLPLIRENITEDNNLQRLVPEERMDEKNKVVRKRKIMSLLRDKQILDEYLKEYEAEQVEKEAKDEVDEKKEIVNEATKDTVKTGIVQELFGKGIENFGNEGMMKLNEEMEAKKITKEDFPVDSQTKERDKQTEDNILETLHSKQISSLVSSDIQFKSYTSPSSPMSKYSVPWNSPTQKQFHFQKQLRSISQQFESSTTDLLSNSTISIKSDSKLSEARLFKDSSLTSTLSHESNTTMHLLEQVKAKLLKYLHAENEKSVWEKKMNSLYPNSYLDIFGKISTVQNDVEGPKNVTNSQEKRLDTESSSWETIDSSSLTSKNERLSSTIKDESSWETIESSSQTSKTGKLTSTVKDSSSSWETIESTSVTSADEKRPWVNQNGSKKEQKTPWESVKKSSSTGFDNFKGETEKIPSFIKNLVSQNNRKSSKEGAKTPSTSSETKNFWGHEVDSFTSETNSWDSLKKSHSICFGDDSITTSEERVKTYVNMERDVQKMINELLVNVHELKESCIKNGAEVRDPMISFTISPNCVINPKNLDIQSRHSHALVKLILDNIIENVFQEIEAPKLEATQNDSSSQSENFNSVKYLPEENSGSVTIDESEKFTIIDENLRLLIEETSSEKLSIDDNRLEEEIMKYRVSKHFKGLKTSLNNPRRYEDDYLEAERKKREREAIEDLRNRILKKADEIVQRRKCASKIGSSGSRSMNENSTNICAHYVEIKPSSNPKGNDTTQNESNQNHDFKQNSENSSDSSTTSCSKETQEPYKMNNCSQTKNEPTDKSCKNKYYSQTFRATGSFGNPSFSFVKEFGKIVDTPTTISIKTAPGIKNFNLIQNTCTLQDGLEDSVGLLTRVYNELCAFNPVSLLPEPRINSLDTPLSSVLNLPLPVVPNFPPQTQNLQTGDNDTESGADSGVENSESNTFMAEEQSASALEFNVSAVEDLLESTSLESPNYPENAEMRHLDLELNFTAENTDTETVENSEAIARNARIAANNIKNLQNINVRHLDDVLLITQIVDQMEQPESTLFPQNLATPEYLDQLDEDDEVRQNYLNVEKRRKAPVEPKKLPKLNMSHILDDGEILSHEVLNRNRNEEIVEVEDESDQSLSESSTSNSENLTNDKAKYHHSKIPVKITSKNRQVLGAIPKAPKDINSKFIFKELNEKLQREFRKGRCNEDVYRREGMMKIKKSKEEFKPDLNKNIDSSVSPFEEPEFFDPKQLEPKILDLKLFEPRNIDPNIEERFLKETENESTPAKNGPIFLDKNIWAKKTYNSLANLQKISGSNVSLHEQYFSAENINTKQREDISSKPKDKSSTVDEEIVKKSSDTSSNSLLENFVSCMDVFQSAEGGNTNEENEDNEDTNDELKIDFNVTSSNLEIHKKHSDKNLNDSEKEEKYEDHASRRRKEEDMASTANASCEFLPKNDGQKPKFFCKNKIDLSKFNFGIRPSKVFATELDRIAKITFGQQNSETTSVQEFIKKNN